MSTNELWRTLEQGMFESAAQMGLPFLQRLARTITGDETSATPVLDLYKLAGISGCIRFARSWPAAYELFRQRLNEETVQALPKRSRERAARLVWRIDAERSRHSTPLGAAKALTDMALDSMFRTNGLSDHLNHLVNGEGLTPRERAKVLPFRRP